MARARSLFAGPDASDTVGFDAASAAAASAGIAGRTDELSGSFATAHGDALDAAVAELHHAAGADARLADHLSRASDAAEAGAVGAQHLHAATDGVLDALDPWSELPVAELAALKALRQHVAEMAQLIAHHTAEAQQVADGISTLEYGQ